MGIYIFCLIFINFFDNIVTLAYSNSSSGLMTEHEVKRFFLVISKAKLGFWFQTY